VTLGAGARLVAVFAGDDLRLALCRTRLGRARVVRSERVARFTALQRLEQESALAALAPFGGQVVVVAPGHSRVVGGPQLDHDQWRSGRAQLLESIEELLPLPRDEAVVGHVDLFDAESPLLERPVGGALVAMRRSDLASLTAPLLAGLGARSCLTLPAFAAAAGVPRVAQRRRCVVVERVGGGAHVAHTYAQGLPVSVEAPLSRQALASLEEALTLPGAQIEGLEAISPEELALGACFVLQKAPTMATPLGGAPPGPLRTLAGPAALAALAAIALAGAAELQQARWRQRDRSLEQAIEQVAPAAMRAQQLRAEALRRRTLLEQGIASTLSSWRSPLPALAALHEALGEEGFYYRVDVDGAGARLRGEAPDASALLQRLVRHPLIASAAFTAPVSVSSLSGMEVFEISLTLTQQGPQAEDPAEERS